MPLADRAFIGWFGIPGVGWFYHAAVAIGTGVLLPDEGGIVYCTIIVCAGREIMASLFARRPGV